MFTVKSNEEIGLHLKTIILKEYKSIRQFCIHYLDRCGRDSKDPAEIKNLENRFSQILNGNKAIQTYDLPIVSELLNVSCEDILSCGTTKVPLTNRRTNYNIAFSNNESDWKDYLSREDCIAAYADEFGKTVLDYAIEFKNYKFIKYLIDKGYITLVAEDISWNNFPNFGAESKIAERPYEHPTLQEEFYNNKKLRLQILSLAIENKDIEALDRFRAKEFPIQFNANFVYDDFDFSDYDDESFINAVSKSNNKVFDYFLHEYSIKTDVKDYEIKWIYPFIDELVIASINSNNKEKALKAINVIIDHNNNLYEKLHKTYLMYAKQYKDLLFCNSYVDALKMVQRDYRTNKDKSFVSLYIRYIREVEPIASNFIHIAFSSNDELIQSKIDEANDIHEKIVNLPNSLIKNG